MIYANENGKFLLQKVRISPHIIQPPQLYHLISCNCFKRFHFSTQYFFPYLVLEASFCGTGGLMGSSPSVPQKSLHEFAVKDSKGNDVQLSNYKGHVLLVVNVASKCMYTKSNYTQLTELYSKYKESGLEILAFPCNQFMHQEPGSSEEAEQFACTTFKAEYPIFQKVKVNGSNAAPVYKFLKASKGGVFNSSIKWNFTKFLVDRNGRVIKRYAASTTPFAIENDILKALKEN